MKIKRDLPQFEGHKALLVVTGRQEGVVYKASDGSIEKIDEIKLETPVYSDREGHFVQSGRGGSYASGAVYENQKEYILEQFQKQLYRDLSDFIKREAITSVYFFAPKHLLKSMSQGIPAGMKKSVKATFGGTYTDCHPFELLEKIAQKFKKDPEEISLSKEEARIKATSRMARSAAPRH